ncbi:hypothetical protein ACF1GY_15950 [Streptomyces sp. NPDC014684]|uniref:hypothetical protein n=1 Tax=unclassified Streptomyces TaxID=2593676 RepID=UPI0033DF38B3
MSKLIRRCAVTGVSAAAAVGALITMGGPASAATNAQASPASVPAAATAHHPSGQAAGHRQPDAWVAGQLAQFCPAAAHSLAIYDPWVKDQIAQFSTPAGN